MKAQHVWAAAATTVRSETMGKQKTGKSVKYLAYGTANTATRMGMLALIMLVCFVLTVSMTVSATDLCNTVDLTVESAYTLPVLPPTVIENFSAPILPMGDPTSNHFHVWLRVLQYSGHPDDKIEVFINGNAVPTDTADSVELTPWGLAGNWVRWPVTLGAPLNADPDVRIQVTTRTDVANPTLVLLSAVDINDNMVPANPIVSDSMNLFDYSSNLGPVESYIKSIFYIPVDVNGTTQDYIARAGGLGTPYIAANMRTVGPVAAGATDTVTLIFGDHEFDNILVTSLPASPASCTPYSFELPAHVMNTPGRPRIRVSLTPAAALTRVIVDDFTLSYVTPVLQIVYPEIAAAANIIINGGFEAGTYPFLIESPIATAEDCPHISEVILDLGAAVACSGSRAAAFKPALDPALIECPVDSTGAGQPPHLPAEAWTIHSSNNTTYVMEYTDILSNPVNNPVSHVTWWGVWLDGGVSCPPASTQFEIAAYDGPSGTQTDLETITPTETLLSDYVYGNAPLYKYEYTFSADEFTRDQYVSIRAIPSGSCEFYWMSSEADGSNTAVDDAGSLINANLSLCISEYSAGDNCYYGSLITQPPTHPLNGLLAQQSTETTPVYQQVDTGGSYVQVIEFWGLWLTDEINDDDRAPCTPPGNPSLVIKYINTGGSDLASGTPDATEAYGNLWPPDAAVSGNAFTAPNGDPVYMYHYVFVPQDNPDTASDDESDDVDFNGWLSVQQTDADDAGCRFYWVESSYGSNPAVTWEGNGNDPADINTSMSLCLGLTLPVATITNCTVTPDIIGKNKTGTVTIEGTDLYSLQSVLLYPQIDQKNIDDDLLYIDLMHSKYAEAVNNDTTVTITFKFSGPFNKASDKYNTEICTDGRATVKTMPPSPPPPPPDPEHNILIDTVEPIVTTLNYSNPLDAATGTPAITSAGRVVPAIGLANWAPGDATIAAPKNNMLNLNDGPVHVYLNDGSRSDVPFSIAAPPSTNLFVNVNAVFNDPEPNDGTNTYPVEISGFTLTPKSETKTPFEPPDVEPEGKGTAYWNGTDPGYVPLSGTNTFSPASEDPKGRFHDLQVTWANEEFLPSEPWRASFKLEAIDLAGNEGNKTAAGTSNSINLHWLFRTKAKFQADPDLTVENPEIYWRLDRSFPDLPDAKPECAPLAFFRLSYFDTLTSTWQHIADSPYLMDTLRGSNSFSGSLKLQQLLNQYQGSLMSLAVFGADETGNIQYDPGSPDPYVLGPQDVDVHIWTNGARRTPNLAVDTTLRVELFHQKREHYDSGNLTLRYRNYGTAQRIPLPPLSEACDTRVEAYLTMKALLPTADVSVTTASKAILWKLYKEGVLVARGTDPIHVLPPPNNDVVFFNLMSKLETCTQVTSVADLSDYDGATFKVCPPYPQQCLNLGLFLETPPIAADYTTGGYAVDEVVDCGLLSNFDYYRLGDEGNQPARGNPNFPSNRRHEVHYTITAQTVMLHQLDEYNPPTLVIDATPAVSNFSIYVRAVEEQVRDETPIREFGR